MGVAEHKQDEGADRIMPALNPVPIQRKDFNVCLSICLNGTFTMLRCSTFSHTSNHFFIVNTFCIIRPTNTHPLYVFALTSSVGFVPSEGFLHSCRAALTAHFPHRPRLMSELRERGRDGARRSQWLSDAIS